MKIAVLIPCYNEDKTMGKNVPYIVKYVRMVSAMGVYNTVRAMLEGKTFADKLGYAIKSMCNILTNDFLGIADKLIDVELNP